MVSMIDNWVQKGQLYYTGISKWKSKADLNIEVGPYRLQIAQTPEQVVGTYRMNPSETSTMFYTSSEFALELWLSRQQSSFVELGRACIHQEHRRGVVLGLLWKGIADYMKLMSADRLIGCSSVKVTDTRSAALLFKYFEQQGMLADEIFHPLEKDNLINDSTLIFLSFFLNFKTSSDP